MRTPQDQRTAILAGSEDLRLITGRGRFSDDLRMSVRPGDRRLRPLAACACADPRPARGGRRALSPA